MGSFLERTAAVFVQKGALILTCSLLRTVVPGTYHTRYAYFLVFDTAAGGGFGSFQHNRLIIRNTRTSMYKYVDRLLLYRPRALRMI